MEMEDAAEMSQETSTAMAGVTEDGQRLLWTEQGLIGDPELVAKIRTHLFMAQVRGQNIAVTPTGPFVEPSEADKEAVFGAGNTVTNYGIRWTNAPDVTYGAPEGAVF